MVPRPPSPFPDQRLAARRRPGRRYSHSDKPLGRNKSLDPGHRLSDQSPELLRRRQHWLVSARHGRRRRAHRPRSLHSSGPLRRDWNFPSAVGTVPTRCKNYPGPAEVGPTSELPISGGNTVSAWFRKGQPLVRSSNRLVTRPWIACPRRRSRPAGPRGSSNLSASSHLGTLLGRSAVNARSRLPWETARGVHERSAGYSRPEEAFCMPGSSFPWRSAVSCGRSTERRFGGVLRSAGTAALQSASFTRSA